MSEHRLEPLINPGSIAILGASADPTRVGGLPLSLLLQHEFAGPIYPINPKYPEISGLRCYPDIESLPGPVDLLALAVAARDVVPQLRRAAAKGIRSAVVFASGFAETNEPEGRRLQDEFEACVREIGIPVAGPNCMGFANLRTHAYTAFASVFRDFEPPRSDHSVALVTQSGNVCSAVYAAGRRRGAKFSTVINTGNEAGIEFSEYLEYFAGQPAIRAIAGYVEGLRDGDRFRRVAKRLQEDGRSLILLKIGDTDKGAEAAASHTASLAGSQSVYRSVFDDLNVMVADDLSHMADLIYLSGFEARRAGLRIAILTISGALGALLSDTFVQAGADVPTLPGDVQAVLRAGIPDFGMVANPVDLTGSVVNQHGFMGQALAALEACEDVDTIVVYAPGALLQKLSPALIEAAKTSRKMIAAIDTLVASTREALEAAGIPIFDDTARAVAALSVFGRWSERRQAGIGAPIASSRAEMQSASTFLATRSGKRTTLDEVDGKLLVAEYGVPVTAERVARTPDEAVAAARELGWPIVVKVLSADILHKSDCGGVRLNLSSDDAVREAFSAVTQAGERAFPEAEITGVVVQRQEAPGTEVLLGVTRDPVFGPVMTVGLGGVFTEILKDIEHRTLPVDNPRAEAMLRRLKAFPLLDGARGRPKRDVQALCQAMTALSDAVLANGDLIGEIEINPLVVRPAGEGVVALDCLAVLRS